MTKRISIHGHGGVGKTMMTVQCLHHHMPGAHILAVDTTNDTAVDFGIKRGEVKAKERAEKRKQQLNSGE